jgi:hypothetical protein
MTRPNEETGIGEFAQRHSNGPVPRFIREPKGNIMTTTKTILTAAIILGAFMGGANALSLKANTKPQAPGSIAAPAQPGATEDYYCKDGHAKFAACSPAFAAACKKIGGTMSGEQGWGGKTCFTPS